MAVYWPPGFPFFPPPPPPHPAPPPPPSFQQYSPTSSDNSSTSPGGVIAGVTVSVGVFLLVLSFACSNCQGHRNRRANAAADAAAAAAALAARPPAPRTAPSWESQEQQRLRGHRSDNHDDDGRSRRASPTANLPSFTYNQSVMHNLTAGSGDEASACSVCLGAFQVGEMVRLLPVCLHLYHVECIDPWLETHSTCPLCRSGTDPTLHVGLLPPV